MKPILIIKVPNKLTIDEIKRCSKVFSEITDLKENYITLMVTNCGINDFEFEGLYPKDFDEKSFEQLKDILKDKLIFL